LVVEDGLPYRTASWHLWRDHRVFVPFATIENWVEAAGKKSRSQVETDYLDWALADFSGYLAADELYDGPFCTTNFENLVRRARFSNPFSGIGFRRGLMRLRPASSPPQPAPRGSPRSAPGPAPSLDSDASWGSSGSPRAPAAIPAAGPPESTASVAPPHPSTARRRGTAAGRGCGTP